MSREILAGKNVALELLRSKKRKIHKVYWGRRREDPKSQELLKLIQQNKIQLLEVEMKALDRLTGFTEHQGVAVEASPFQYAELETVAESASKNPKGGFLILLDEIQDPHNVGALTRSAHLCGASGLVLLKHRQVDITPAVCKAAAGAEEYLPIVKEVNLVGVINALKSKNFTILGASGRDGESLFEVQYSFPIALILGSEQKGIRRLVRENCDRLISIPMEGLIDSFNVSVAGGIIMAEIMKKRLLSS